MQNIVDAIQSGVSGSELAALPIPESYRAAYVHRNDVGIFEGVASKDKDPRQSLHIGEVATPVLAPDEVYLAVMASSINFNNRHSMQTPARASHLSIIVCSSFCHLST